MDRNKIHKLIVISRSVALKAGWFAGWSDAETLEEANKYYSDKLDSILYRAVIANKIKNIRMSHALKDYLKVIAEDPPFSDEHVSVWEGEDGNFIFESDLSFVFIWAAALLSLSNIVYSPQGKLTEDGDTKGWLHYIMEICLKAIRESVTDNRVSEMHLHDILQVCLRIAEDEGIDLYKTVPLTAQAWVKRMKGIK